ncbi:MAG: FlgD immunoglobulin-like domain containing protein [Candidatus Cloacimonadota bacterium]
MKQRWLVLLALVALTAMLMAGNTSRYEVVHYQEDFESGATGWTHYDGGEAPSNWHIYNNGDAQGNVWWMGDPDLASGANIGGYHDHHYVVLDTPARTIAAGSTALTFKLRYYVEEPTGATAPYTGWDACNVRISTDGGTTWTPISGTPAYNMTSAYSFGFEHGEGPNIPGWGGVQATWVNANFDLSAYVGQSVKIRFAFGSDPAYSTGDAPAMFGMMVDDISVGGYTNNGVDDGQMTWSSMVPLGGDHWHIATDALAPSPSHVMALSNDQGTYNTNMMNYLVSPEIVLPTSGDIRADFMIKGLFTDPDTFPEVDYFGWEISVDGGISWLAMSNPFGDPAGSNYVYSDAPPEWASMVDSYTLTGLLSPNYAGQTAIFRWYFKSDSDAPSGTGLMIDDFKIYNDIFIAEPENLTAEVTGSNVALNWTTPGGGGGGEPGWLNYDGENAGNSIGTNAAADFDVAAKWDPVGEHGISPWVGMNITKIKVFPAEPATLSSYAVRIWTGAAGNMVYEQAITNPVSDQWNEIILTTPWTIPAQSIVMAGYRCNATGGYPAGCDDATAPVEGYGNVIRFNNAWTTLTALGATLTYNWNIRIYVEDAAGREYVLGQDLPENYQITSGELAVNRTETRDRDVTAYKIYRDAILIDEVPGTQLNYTDMNVEGGLHTYYVTAMYGTNESLASNTVSAFVLPSMHAELMNDDGTAEAGYTVGSTRQMAAKFVYDDPVTVKYAKVFVHTQGTAGIIIRVFDDNGTDGMPGTQMAQFQYPAANVVPGWNFITLPENINDANGTFYIAILETAGASQIGLDTNHTGHSYKRLTTAWEPITEGDVMIRAIVQYTVSNEGDVTVPVFSANNYPNPFNPSTTIAYSIPTTSNTTLRVYNIKGQVVKTLVNGVVEAGNHSITWNGRDDNGTSVASGVYFYRLSSEGQTLTKKMVLSK